MRPMAIVALVLVAVVAVQLGYIIWLRRQVDPRVADLRGELGVEREQNRVERERLIAMVQVPEVAAEEVRRQRPPKRKPLREPSIGEQEMAREAGVPVEAIIDPQSAAARDLRAELEREAEEIHAEVAARGGHD